MSLKELTTKSLVTILTEVLSSFSILPLELKSIEFVSVKLSLSSGAITSSMRSSSALVDGSAAMAGELEASLQSFFLGAVHWEALWPCFWLKI